MNLFVVEHNHGKDNTYGVVKLYGFATKLEAQEHYASKGLVIEMAMGNGGIVELPDGDRILVIPVVAESLAKKWKNLKEVQGSSSLVLLQDSEANTIWRLFRDNNSSRGIKRFDLNWAYQRFSPNDFLFFCFDLIVNEGRWVALEDGGYCLFVHQDWTGIPLPLDVKESEYSSKKQLEESIAYYAASSSHQIVPIGTEVNWRGYKGVVIAITTSIEESDTYTIALFGSGDAITVRASETEVDGVIRDR